MPWSQWEVKLMNSVYASDTKTFIKGKTPQIIYFRNISQIIRKLAVL